MKKKERELIRQELQPGDLILDCWPMRPASISYKRIKSIRRAEDVL